MTPPSASITTDNQRYGEEFIGVLEVSIHQARDVHNICIYQEQDVYIKLYLMDKLEKSISSHVINGGGRNPVFNETLKLGVRTLESSLRCEVWMLSRIRNYLADQLLGFVLVPLSDVISENGKPAREFELSGTEIFHSQAGFIELSFNYTGRLPEITEIPISCTSSMNNVAERDLDVPCELNRIDFPDPKLVIDNEIMVSEYISIPREQLEPQVAKKVVEPVSSIMQPLISVVVEPEEKVVQEDIVDMYMKSMKEFTDALEKMKLPMEEDWSSTDGKLEDSGSDGKGEELTGLSQKVFYGSRAFF